MDQVHRWCSTLKPLGCAFNLVEFAKTPSKGLNVCSIYGATPLAKY